MNTLRNYETLSQHNIKDSNTLYVWEEGLLSLAAARRNFKAIKMIKNWEKQKRTFNAIFTGQEFCGSRVSNGFICLNHNMNDINRKNTVWISNTGKFIVGFGIKLCD